MIKGFKTMDEFLAEKNRENDNDKNTKDAEINVFPQKPKKTEPILLLDNECVRYEIYEIINDISGLPIDVFIGCRKR